MSKNVLPHSELIDYETEAFSFSMALPDYAPAEQLGLDIERLIRRLAARRGI